jgi:hypothetical protein
VAFLNSRQPAPLISNTELDCLNLVSLKLSEGLLIGSAPSFYYKSNILHVEGFLCELYPWCLPLCPSGFSVCQSLDFNQPGVLFVASCMICCTCSLAWLVSNFHTSYQIQLLSITRFDHPTSKASEHVVIRSWWRFWKMCTFACGAVYTNSFVLLHIFLLYLPSALACSTTWQAVFKSSCHLAETATA